MKFHMFFVKARYPKLLENPNILDEFASDTLWIAFQRFLYEDQIEDIREHPSKLNLEDYYQIGLMGDKLELPRMAWHARLRLRERLNKANYLEYLFLANKYNCDDELALGIKFVLQDVTSAKNGWEKNYGNAMPKEWYECTMEENDIKVNAADKLDEPPSTFNDDLNKMTGMIDPKTIIDPDMKITFIDPTGNKKTYQCHQAIVEKESAYFRALMSFNKNVKAMASDVMDI